MATIRSGYAATVPDSFVLDTAFYDAVAEAANSAAVTQSVWIPPRTGAAWRVPAGSVCRIVLPEGPQVGDLNVWNAHNPRERMWVARTRQIEGTCHARKYTRVWSTLPYLRPLFTVTADTLERLPIAEDGARPHDLLGTRCDPYVGRLLNEADFDQYCHSNLLRAVLPHGLTELDLHDVINVFQLAGVSPEGDYFMLPTPVETGDYFEFFAEVDLLCALSACPAGDETIPTWGPDAGDASQNCHPLKAEVRELPAVVLAGWSSPTPSPYAGQHGLVDGTLSR